MKKNARADQAHSEPRHRRALRLSNETLRVLSSTDLAQALGGCDSTSSPTQACTKPNTGH